MIAHTTQINDTVKQMMQAGESAKDIRRHLDMEEPSMENVYQLLCKLCNRFKKEHMQKHLQVCVHCMRVFVIIISG